MPAIAQEILASMLEALAGFYAAVAPLILGYYPMASSLQTNDVMVGTGVVILATIRTFGAYRSAWLSWTSAALGVWLMFSPLLLGYGGMTTALVNDVVTGAIITALGAWAALVSPPVATR